MDKNEVELHVLLAKLVQELQYGQLTVNIQVKNGKPILPTLNVVKSRRKRYKPVKIDNNTV